MGLSQQNLSLSLFIYLSISLSLTLSLSLLLFVNKDDCTPMSDELHSIIDTIGKMQGWVLLEYLESQQSFNSL